jgi:hypothetical protein
MPAAKRTNPEILEMPDQNMAVVYTHGEPGPQMERVMPALFGSVFGLKFTLKKQGREMKVGPLRARWPDAHTVGRDEWTGIWGLPVPEDVTEIASKDRTVELKVERWTYGTVAQILHIGPYSEEQPSVNRLHEFIAAEGYELAGPHEEEYLTKPDAREIRTILRYAVRKR